MRRNIIIIISLFLALFVTAAHAERLLMYGFEDWDGSIQNTQNYIFSQGYQEYLDTHARATEVVQQYNGWTPHSGSYMYLQNDSSDIALSPSISGIPGGAINAHNNIGVAGAYGGQNPLNIEQDINTGEIFIRFWSRNNQGFGSIDGGGRCKWIRIYTNGDIYDTVYMHLETAHGTDSVMYFYCGNEGTWLGSGVTLPNAFDGNWHKYSIYVNWNTGVIRGWYDVDNENAGNATKVWTAGDGRIGTGTRPAYFVIQGNFSAKHPTEITYHALDDVEVWNGMPDGSAPTDPDPTDPDPTDPAPTDPDPTDPDPTDPAPTDPDPTDPDPTDPDPTDPPVSFNQEFRLSLVAWNANSQTNDSSWSDSSATWCARVLVKGDSITTSTNSNDSIILGFQGRNSGEYTIRKVSIAERDPSGQDGDIIDGTWTRVTFDNNSASSWASSSAVVPSGRIKRSDAVPFTLQKGKDYYVTFILDSPSSYLLAPSDYSEMYFDGTDHTEDLDWGNNGHRTYAERLHALSNISIYSGN
jgi:hypothetical protein